MMKPRSMTFNIWPLSLGRCRGMFVFFSDSGKLKQYIVCTSRPRHIQSILQIRFFAVNNDELIYIILCCIVFKFVRIKALYQFCARTGPVRRTRNGVRRNPVLWLRQAASGLLASKMHIHIPPSKRWSQAVKSHP